MVSRLFIRKPESLPGAELEAQLRQPTQSAARVIIRFTRRSTRALDQDNLSASFKALQDQCRDCGLIADDDPETIQAFYQQTKVGSRKETGTLIEIEYDPS